MLVEGQRRTDLGAFLRAQRARLTPEEVGLPRGARRHTTGLRREEVAQLANIGIGWYTWLEQGRPINVSVAVLRRIARALRLDADQTTYLFSLAGLADVRGVSGAAAVVDEAVQLSLDGFTSGPACLLDRVFDVLAWNRLGARVFGYDGAATGMARNHVWQFFTTPENRTLYVDWEGSARHIVAMLRMTYADNSHDAFLTALIQELVRQSPEFRTYWSAQVVGRAVSTVIDLDHPQVGRLSLYSVKYQDATHPGQIVFFHPPTSTESERRLQALLATLAPRDGV